MKQNRKWRCIAPLSLGTPRVDWWQVGSPGWYPRTRIAIKGIKIGRRFKNILILYSRPFGRRGWGGSIFRQRGRGRQAEGDDFRDTHVRARRHVNAQRHHLARGGASTRDRRARAPPDRSFLSVCSALDRGRFFRQLWLFGSVATAAKPLIRIRRRHHKGGAPRSIPLVF